MIKPLERTVLVLIIFQLLLFSSSFSVYGEVPVIASRVSTVMEIAVIIHSEHNKPNNTLFSMKVAVEILNRDNKNYTVST